MFPVKFFQKKQMTLQQMIIKLPFQILVLLLVKKILFTIVIQILPVNNTHQKEIDFIRNNLSQGQINWLTLGNSPLNEYNTPYLATMVFPTLFPDGKGDPANPAILKNVTLKEKVNHLIKFAEKKDSKWIYRFANHPRFSY